LLSSGITPGRVGDQSDQQRIIDPLRSGDPPGYWTDYQIRIEHEQLDVPFESRVCQSDPTGGLLLIDPPLPLPVQVGARYELRTEEEAPLAAVRYLSGRTLAEPLPEADVRLGTTRGTNALLTRSGAKTALVTTRGFADVLLVGYQDRPRLFDLQIRKFPPLYEATIEIDERISAEGEVLQSPDAQTVRTQLTALRRDGIQALAICLLHAYRYPEHEQLVLRCAQEVGFHNTSLSSDVAHLMGIVARGDTTVVDAYLNPVLQEYINRIEAKLNDTGRLRLMTSAGGLVSGSEYRGKDSILSGPAGGVVGFSEAAKACGFDRAIGFDMGGTSTDTSRYDGSFSLEYEREKAGVRLVAPMMAIHTVAAGGGSICRFDGVKPVVGPESAGADPGPACYGRGGPLTVTDVNLLLGKIFSPRFPFPLDQAAATDRADRLVEQVREQSDRHYQRLQLCEGFLQIANANMAAAVREISIAQGVDPRDYLLVAFGGAAAQHACGIARELQMQRILVHPDAGILSAYGIGRARILRHAARGIYAPYETERLAEMEAIFEELSAQAREQVLAEGVDQRRLESSRFLELRYQGTDSAITIHQPSDGDYATAYHSEHRSRYGYDKPDHALEIVAARIEVASRTEGVQSRSVALPPTTPEATDHQDVYFEGQLCPTSIFDHAQLEPGDRLPGPAIICSATSTVVVDPGWQATMYSGGELLIDEQGQKQKKKHEVTTESDPIMLEVFNNRFMAIARQMGITLRNTASSVNVKQRLDFSCAIFTADGALVANAPHVPVHLGAMGATVRSILKENHPLKPGDVYLTNDPYRGGSHLPDITVVTPVHDPNDNRLLFFTASRAHHAEIGGIRPGSMPPCSPNVAEDGVLLGNVALF
jgi:5-oxoprolinase (ATP-hydrolysing)